MNRFSRRIRAGIAFAAALLPACGGDGTTAPGDLAAAASITIESIGDTLLLQEAKPLRATLRDAEGNRLADRAVAWSSSDPATLAVSAGGTVSALRGGSASIIATSGGVSDTVTLVARRLQFERVHAGHDHMCGLDGSGEAWCWGATGISSGDRPAKPAASAIPSRPAPGTHFSALALGSRFTCGIRLAGDVVCWGRNSHGQLGDGTTADRRSPAPVACVTSAIALTAGSDHACALAGGGIVRCWGANGRGQLGDGTYVDRPLPVQVASLSAATALSGGYTHTCASTSGGAVCWGGDDGGELGHDTTYNRLIPTRAGAPAGSSPTYAAISAAVAHSCALDAGGAASCWGTLEPTGGFSEMHLSPVPAAQGHQFTALFDDRAQCGLKTGGELWCWEGLRAPEMFPGVGAVVDAAVDYLTPCALIAGGSVRCWNPGNGIATPGTVTGAPPLIDIAASSTGWACGLGAAGDSWCWPSFGVGQGATTAAKPGSTGATSQALVSIWDGARRVCALTAAGDPWCSTQFQVAPEVSFVPEAGGLGFVSLALGLDHTCGLQTSGTAWCWGANSEGQLGDGTTTPRIMPVQVQGGLQFTSIDAGYYHTCGRTGDGAMWCWGSTTAGQLGDGNRPGSAVPVPVAGSPTLVSLAGTGSMTCGLQQGGAAVCWPGGQPVVTGPAPFVALAVGARHACGLDAAGIAYCWGSTDGGALGDGQDGINSSPTPHAVLGGLHFGSIASGGGGTTCGITTAGNTWCWGYNNGGSLGSPDAAGTFASGVPVRMYGQE